MFAASSNVTYRAFISYSHRDKAWGDWLHKALETYRVPSRLVGTRTEAGVIPRRLNPIFRDREELASATDLGSEVNEALARSECLIVICSPAAAASRWVNEEVLAFKRTGRGERIFCLIVDGEPDAAALPGREAEECFCRALRCKLDADGHPTAERAEPIGADARGGKDGKTNAKLKIIAGMLGVGFDALKQREQHRKLQRMVVITALALVMMAVTTLLAVFALISRHDAVAAQRKAVAAEQIAVVARNDAQRRQIQAEGILGFMLGDLRKKLATVGRLDLMHAVDNKATTYFATLNPRDLSDTTLEQQARLLTDIGQVRLAEGKLGAAVSAFREALDRSSALYRRAPRRGDRLFDMAQAEYWIGFAAMQQGDYATAGALFRKYHGSAVKLAAMDRHNFKWQKEVAYGLQALAVMDKNMGRTDAAERGMQAQLALYRDWLEQRPRDLQLRFETANVVSWLGSLALEQGDLGAAETYFAEQVRELQRNRATEPENANWEDYSVDALGWLGLVQQQRGRLAQARSNYAASTALAAALYARDPENNAWRAALARCQLSQSELDAVHQPRRAAEEARRAESLLLAARAADPKSQPVLESLAHAHNQLARLALARNDPGTAAKHIAASLALIGPAWKGKPNDSLRLRLAQTRLLQGEIEQRQGQAAAAAVAWNETRGLLVGDSKGEIAFNRLDLLVRALQLLGRGAEAAPYLQRLGAAGYVPLQRWPNTPAAPVDRTAGRTRSTRAGSQ